MLNKEILAELLQRAAGEPFGLWITCSNPRDLSRQIHIVRGELNSEIEICTPGLPDTLFLVQPSAELPLL